MGLKHMLNVLFAAFYFTTTWLSEQAVPDSASSGNYLILECGLRTDSIKALLQQTYQSLEYLISSTDTDTPVYTAFFNGVEPANVTAVYSRMAAGSDIIVWISSRQPTLVCVNGPESDQWEWCKTSIFLAGHVRRSQYIILCNGFFDRIPLPAPGDCGRTNRANTALINVPADTQYGILVHELVHLYLQHSALIPEVYDINDVISLPSEEKAVNPGNYEYYAQNVKANCTDFPTARKRLASPDRELSSHAVSTSSDAIDSSDSCGEATSQTCSSP